MGLFTVSYEEFKRVRQKKFQDSLDEVKRREAEL